MTYSVAEKILSFVVITAAAVLIPALSAASLTYVEEMGMPVSVPAMQMPKWTNGGLLTVQFKDPKYPLIWMLTRSGARSLPFSIPGADSTLIYDLDQRADGTIGISGSASDSEGRVAGYVAWISPNETSAQVVRTGLYRPAMVAIAPDGTMWTVGRELDTLTPPVKLLPHVGVIRHFDRSGKTLDSFVPQSTVRTPSLTLTRNTLRASKDRIAWYCVGDGRYVEISFSGNVLADIAVDVPIDGGKPMSDNISFALTDEGDAFLSVPYLDPSSKQFLYRMYLLNRSARVWDPVPLGGQPPRNHTGYIFGADGRRLVVMSGKVVQFYAIGK
jgi:hypothetical protein